MLASAISCYVESEVLMPPRSVRPLTRPTAHQRLGHGLAPPRYAPANGAPLLQSAFGTPC